MQQAAFCANRVLYRRVVRGLVAVRRVAWGAVSPRVCWKSCMAAETTAAAAGAHPLLVLHLDVNKTVLAVDPAGGKTVTHVLNGIIGAAAWGRVSEDGAWTLASNEISIGKPPASAGVPFDEDAPLSGAVQHGLCTYRYFLEEMTLKYEDMRALMSSGVSDEEIAAATKRNKVVKKKRNDLQLVFTDEGQVGAALRPVFDELMDAVMLSEDKPRGLIPSYFELIREMRRRNRDFAIVFRTFGTDIPDIIEEHNAFVAGTHPTESSEGLDLSAFHISTPHDTGRITRSADRAGDPGSGVRLAHVSQHNTVIITEGYNSIHDVVIGRIRGGQRALALQDDYLWWHSHDETPEAGKLLVFDPEDSRTHHIFFDDHVGFTDTDLEIVDCRTKKGEIVTYKDAIDVFAVKAELTEALLDHRYFVKNVDRCEANRNKARM